jgi:hypothetical protein
MIGPFTLYLFIYLLIYLFYFIFKFIYFFFRGNFFLFFTRKKTGEKFGDSSFLMKNFTKFFCSKKFPNFHYRKLKKKKPAHYPESGFFFAIFIF